MMASFLRTRTLSDAGALDRRLHTSRTDGHCFRTRSSGHSLSSTHLCAQQIWDNLDTFAHMQTVCARQFRRRKATPDPPHRADTPRPSPAKP
jgi:hypothetical protein